MRFSSKGDVIDEKTNIGALKLDKDETPLKYGSTSGRLH